jgi:hypothetical protein
MKENSELILSGFFTQGAQPIFRLATAAYESPVGQTRALGSWLDVTVQQEQIFVMGKAPYIQIQSLTALQTQGNRGQARMQMFDLLAQNGQVTVRLPQSLERDSLVNVAVMANVTPQSIEDILAAQKNNSRFSKLEDSMANRIRSAPRRNG